MKRDSKELIDETADDYDVSLTHEDITIQHELAELGLKKEVLIGNRQDREERKKYAVNIFRFLSWFVGIMLAIVVLCGFKVLHLDDSVIITLISTTAANIIGIFIYVVKYLFKASN